MNRTLLSACAAALTLSVLAGSAEAFPTQEGDSWPSWRGPDRNGVAPSGGAPTVWGEEKNVRWRAELPGLGISTPVVWGDYLYVTTAVETDKLADGAKAEPEPAEGQRRGRGRRGRGSSGPKKVHEFRVMCVSRADGSLVWSQKVAETAPHEGIHGTNSQASASPITDGEHIWAFFGSRGLHCLDMEGDLVWSKDFGKMKTRNEFGEGASPAIHGDKIVVLWDHEGVDFIAAVNKETGKEAWRTERNEVTTWVTPLIVPVGDQVQVITTGTDASRAYNLENGEEIWSIGGMTTNCVPTPIHHDGVVYLMSGFRGSALQAIKLEGAVGDLKESKNLLWSYGKNTPYVPSGVLVDGKLYFLRVNSGRVTCLDAASGKEHFSAENLGGIRSVYASLTASGEYIYAASREGETVIFKVSDTFEQVASNTLDDAFDASPVMVDGELYLRGRKALYCITADGD
ncbi:PQQ-like beta-propeller repeat protein [bacterium]|nr:PQQ-like beta-propeller repeat protein [bacterium]